MADKLQELTQRIYDEGVAKAKEEADKIVAEAKRQAEEVIKKAQTDAHAIVTQAEKRSDEIRQNVQSEVQLASKQAVSAVKQKIVDLVTAKVVEQPVKEMLGDGEFLKKVVLEAVHNFKPAEMDSVDLDVVLPRQMEKDLGEYFRQAGQQAALNGLTVLYSDEMKGGFRIGPSGGGYKISFTDEDFANFFKDYLRPRTIKVLYGE